MASIYQRLQFRRGTLADFDSYNPVLASGEPAYAVDGRILKIGDGEQSWTNLVGFHYDLDNSIMSGIAVFGSGQAVRVSGAITTEINNLIDSAPATLDTLNEIAAAIDDDANFIGTFLASGHAYTNALAGASGTLRADLTSASGALDNKITVTSGTLNNTIVVSGTNFLTDLDNASGALNNHINVTSGVLNSEVIASGTVERADTIASGTLLRQDVLGVSGIVDIVSGVAVFGSGQATRIDTLETNSGLLNTSVGVLETNSGLLNTSVGVLETNSGLLNTSVGVLETNSGLLNTSVGVLETNSGLLNTSVGLLETTSGLLNTSVGILETNSGLLNTSVGILEVNSGELNTSVDGVSGILDIVSGIAVFASGNGGGGGSSTFVGLSDSPSNFSGAASKFVKVNSAANALEFVAVGAGGSMDNVVEDTTPQLGGDLDTNNKTIIFTSGSTQYANIGIPNGSGDLHISVDAANAESDADRIQFNIDGTQVLSMTSPGGLDTTNIKQQLDINTNEQNRTIFGYSENTFNVNKNNIDFAVFGDSLDDVLFVDASADSVGIKTNTPGFDLDVRGSGRFIYSDGKCGLAIVDDGGDQSGIHIGDCALNANAAFAGIKHSHYTGNNDYMMVSENTNTYISAKDGGSVFIRGGGNAAEAEIRIHDVGAGSVGIVFNEAGSDRDIRMEGTNDTNLFRLDASTDRIGIGTATPSVNLDVNGSGKFTHANGTCGLMVEDEGGSGIHIGDCAFSFSATYAGVKHSLHTSNQEYMIISDGTDTFVSAGDGNDLYLRGGGNNTSSEILIKDVNNGQNGIIFNNNAADRDITMSSTSFASLFKLDASENRIGINTAIPQHTLAVSGTFNANEVNVSGSPAVYSSPTQAGDTASTNVSGVHNIVFTDAAGYSAVSKNEDTIYFVV